MAVTNEPGGYVYLPGLSFASDGVVALPGFALERAVFPWPRLLPDGFSVIQRHLEDVGRPLAALCGIELRSPLSVPVAEFLEFNRGYNAQLESWGLLRDGAVPLARTNVAPIAHPPAGPAVLAFSYTVPRAGVRPDFVVSGVPELPPGASYPEGIVRPGESGIEALADKSRAAIEAVDARLRSLGAVWDDSVSVHLYTTYPAADIVYRELNDRIAVVPAHGMVWHRAAPPVDDLALEIDVRCNHGEWLLPDS